MEFEKIKQLINDVSDSKLTSVDIELPDGTKLSMKKEVKQETVVVNSVPEMRIPPHVFDKTEIKVNDVNMENKINDKKQLKETEDGKIVKSPMVGTFYSKPSPTSNPYVEVGKSVQKGDTLCIIEAMKLMNEIESEFSGKIVEVLVNDGDTVEYGTPLFKII